MHEPRLVLLDEPTLGVDPQSRRNVRHTIAELARQGATVTLGVLVAYGAACLAASIRLYRFAE